MGRFPGRMAACARAGTVHVGGTLEEIAAAEQSVSRGDRAGATIRVAGAAEPLRSHARATGQAHRLGLLPCSQWLRARHDRAHRGADRALCAGIWRPHPGAPHAESGADGARTTPTTSAAISTAAYRISASFSPALSRGWTPTRRRTRRCTSARRQPRRAAASTACAATMPHAPPCAPSSPDGRPVEISNPNATGRGRGRGTGRRGRTR